MKLPIAISVPHAGLLIPDEAAPYCQLSHEQIVRDGDEGAADIYKIKDRVTAFITTDIARAIVDVNRARDNRDVDGVVKTQTIWCEPVYVEELDDVVVDTLLTKYYDPYHARLRRLASRDIAFAVDCHTMVAQAPPIGPNAGTNRPEICIGNLHGQVFPAEWTSVLHRCFLESFDGYSVTLNEPFAGGYITRTHGRTIPWIQLEVSRSGFLPASEIRRRVFQSLSTTCERLGL